MTTTNINPATLRLANAFSAILNEWLTPAELEEANSKNRQYGMVGDDCCATHEFCDPNQAMLDAFEKTFGREVSFDEDMETIESAWHFAKFWQFNEVNHEHCNGVDLFTKKNGKGFTTLGYKDGQFACATVADLVDGGKSSIEKARLKVA